MWRDISVGEKRNEKINMGSHLHDFPLLSIKFLMASSCQPSSLTFHNPTILFSSILPSTKIALLFFILSFFASRLVACLSAPCHHFHLSQYVSHLNKHFFSGDSASDYDLEVKLEETHERYLILFNFLSSYLILSYLILSFHINLLLFLPLAMLEWI